MTPLVLVSDENKGVVRAARDHLEEFARSFAAKLVQRAFAAKVVATYRGVREPSDASQAAQEMLARKRVREFLWIFDAESRRLKTRGASLASARAFPWLTALQADRLDLLNKLIDAFNRWGRLHVVDGGEPLPRGLDLLLRDGGTSSFHHAFTDGRIAPSLRRAYFSHRSLVLHASALQMVHGGALEPAAGAPVSAALDESLSRALGFALGLPGTESACETQGVDLSGIEPLDLVVEQKNWTSYLLDAGQLD